MHVFVYGTLTDPDRASAVLDDFAYRGDAVLDGLHRVDGAYPTLAPGGSVRDRILTTDDVAALDEYEGVESGLYVRVSLPATVATGDSAEAVQTYVGVPDALDVPVEWSGEGPFEERVQSYLQDRAVSLDCDPDRDR